MVAKQWQGKKMAVPQFKDITVPVYLTKKMYRQLEELARVTARSKAQVLRDGLQSMVMEAEAAGLVKGGKKDDTRNNSSRG